MSHFTGLQDKYFTFNKHPFNMYNDALSTSGPYKTAVIAVVN